jgi:CRISPR system Cascade subunit CasC
MSRPRFVQIHSLASYPGTLLNRDDAGLAKRLPFGGTVRLRVSSQALKRKWRFAGEGDHEKAAKVPYALQGLGVPMGDRTRELVDQVLRPAALAGLPELHPTIVSKLVDKLNVLLYGDKGAEKQKRQALFFGRPEQEFVQGLARSIAQDASQIPGLLASAGAEPDKKAVKEFEAVLKEQLDPEKKVLSTLGATTRGAAGLESALFGRMVTSDTSANVNAPIHVAHALSVHAVENELDYVTAVDDLRQRSEDGETGSAGIFDIELTSGLFYGYVNIDVDLLVANLNGDAALAGRVVERLVKLIARTSPGAKKGSTAPYAHAEFMLVETGDDQPRTLANAYRRSVPLEGDVFETAVLALQTHLDNLDRAYGRHTERQQLSVTPPALDGVPVAGLDALCDTLRQRIEAT